MFYITVLSAHVTSPYDCFLYINFDPNYFMKLRTKSLSSMMRINIKYVNSSNCLLNKELFLWEQGITIAHHIYKINIEFCHNSPKVIENLLRHFITLCKRNGILSLSGKKCLTCIHFKSFKREFLKIIKLQEDIPKTKQKNTQRDRYAKQM